MAKTETPEEIKRPMVVRRMACGDVVAAWPRDLNALKDRVWTVAVYDGDAVEDSEIEDGGIRDEELAVHFMTEFELLMKPRNVASVISFLQSALEAHDAWEARVKAQKEKR